FPGRHAPDCRLVRDPGGLPPFPCRPGAGAGKHRAPLSGAAPPADAALGAAAPAAARGLRCPRTMSGRIFAQVCGPTLLTRAVSSPRAHCRLLPVTETTDGPDAGVLHPPAVA